MANENNEVNPTRPTLSWSDVELLKFLADIWDQKSHKNIQVVGRLNQVDGELHAFLTDLHHPASGIKLPLSGNSTENRVFVPSSELQRFHQSQASTTFALATLDLSPLTRREDRRDPLACKVRRGTLTPLVSIPAEWGVPRAYLRARVAHHEHGAPSNRSPAA